MKLEKEIKLKKLLLLKLSIIPLFLVIFSLGVHAQKIDSLNSVVKFEIDGIGWSEVEGEIKVIGKESELIHPSTVVSTTLI